MNIRFVCDCCNQVFSGFDLDEEDLAKVLTLTDIKGHDIIIQKNKGSEELYKLTCKDCKRWLMLDDTGFKDMYKTQLLN